MYLSLGISSIYLYILWVLEAARVAGCALCIVHLSVVHVHDIGRAWCRMGGLTRSEF